MRTRSRSQLLLFAALLLLPACSCNGEQALPPAIPVAIASDLARVLLISSTQVSEEGENIESKAMTARLEILSRQNGAWKIEVLEDPQSNVFHKAMPYPPASDNPGILTLGGSAAKLKLWKRVDQSWRSQLLWSRDFGGKFSRMRDAEVADLTGDGRALIAVGTHDQGVVALVDEGGVRELDQRPMTFVHEIEIGDLNGDGVLEIYASVSEPNRSSSGPQAGSVLRYVPSEEGEPTVVASWTKRHAKEILVSDVDGDGKDELYVVVEALLEGPKGQQLIIEEVEVRRYEAETCPSCGQLIASFQDRQTRFLTVGQPTADGRKLLVAATFSAGLWTLSPGEDPGAPWKSQNIEPDSSGYEHAALFADLDEDGRSELYVAADDQRELRRYVWDDAGQVQRDTILEREGLSTIITWNIVSAPLSIAGLNK